MRGEVHQINEFRYNIAIVRTYIVEQICLSVVPPSTYLTANWPTATGSGPAIMLIVNFYLRL